MYRFRSHPRDEQLNHWPDYIMGYIRDIGENERKAKRIFSVQDTLSHKVSKKG
jgi:hypothetical protein